MQIELEKDKTLSEIVSKLKAHFKPEKIFLFGSYAQGTATSDSDYDLFLIIKDTQKSMMDRMDEANLVLKGRRVPVDVFVFTEKEFDEAKNQFQSLAYIVSNEGVELTL
jgi:predicted nucleotidyltransferase